VRTACFVKCARAYNHRIWCVQFFCFCDLHCN